MPGGKNERSALLPPAKERRRTVVGIEGLRPLLTLHIIVMHWPFAGSQRSPGAPRVEQSFLNATQNGYVAVELFLVMSGFVIGLAGHSFEDRREQLRFVARRVARLAPTYYASWFLTLLVYKTLAVKKCRSEYGPWYVVPLDVAMLQSWLNLSFPEATWLECHPTVSYLPFILNGPLWYVSTLVGCYVLYALFARIARTPWRCVAAAGAFSFCRGLLVFFSTFQERVRTSELTFALLDAYSLSLPGLLKHFPPCAFLGFLAGAYAGAASRLFAEEEDDEGVLQWRVWLVADSALLALTLSMVLFTDFAPVLCPCFCLFVFAATCERQGLVLRALSQPFLVSLAPSTYAAYAFLTPFRAALHYSGWDLSLVAVYSWYVVGLVTFALLWEAYVDKRARAFLLASFFPSASDDGGASSPSGSGVDLDFKTNHAAYQQHKLKSSNWLLPA